MILLLRRLFPVEMFSFMKPICHFIISLTILLPFLCHPLFSYILTLLTLLSLRLRYPHLLFPLQPLLLPSPHPLLTLIASPLHLPLVPLKISSLSPYLLMSIFPPWGGLLSLSEDHLICKTIFVPVQYPHFLTLLLFLLLDLFAALLISVNYPLFSQLILRTFFSFMSLLPISKHHLIPCGFRLWRLKFKPYRSITPALKLISQLVRKPLAVNGFTR